MSSVPLHDAPSHDHHDGLHPSDDTPAAVMVALPGAMNIDVDEPHQAATATVLPIPPEGERDHPWAPRKTMFPGARTPHFAPETPWHKEAGSTIAKMGLWNALHLFTPMEWGPRYSLAKLRQDVISGLVVTVMLVPQALAYAQLAGLKPVYGLYASIAPVIAYTVFGQVPCLAVGPVALLSILTSEVTDKFPIGDEAGRAQAAFELSLITGIISVALSIFQAGFLTRFVSHCVTSAFTSGAAILILLSQIKHIFGLNIPKADTLHEYIQNLVDGFKDADANTGYTFLFSLWMVLYLLLVRYVKVIPASFPHQLVVVVVSTLITWGTSLHSAINLAIVKTVPSGAMPIATPSLSTFGDHFQLCFVMVIVGFVESYAVSRKFAGEQDFDFSSTRELLALGTSNIVGSFFGAYPTTGGISRTAVQALLRSATPLASTFTGIGVIIVVFGLNQFDVFYYLPKSCLAAIVAAACIRMVDYKKVVSVYKQDKGDFAVWVLSFLAVLFLGVENGIMIGIAFGVLLVVLRVSDPKMPELGVQKSAEGLPVFRDCTQHEDLVTYPNIALWRFDAPLFFINADNFVSRCGTILHSDHYSTLNVVIVDCAGVTAIDSDGAHAFLEAQDMCRGLGCELLFASIKRGVKETLERDGAWPKKFNESNCFPSVTVALEEANKLIHAKIPSAAPSESVAPQYAQKH